MMTSLISLFTTNLSAEIYFVKKNDSLGKIIQNHFPDFKIFGKKGMLRKILKFNPEIKNPNFIFTHQKIILPDIKLKETSTAAIITPVSITKPAFPMPARLIATEVTSSITLLNHDDSLLFKILYGANISSLQQSQTLSNLNITTLSSNVFKLESEFSYENDKLLGSFSSHTFGISSENETHTKRFSHFDFIGVRNNLLLGFSYKESPLIKATTSTLALNKESQIGVLVGHDKKWNLQARKPTTLNFRSALFIPLKNSSDTSDVALSSIMGVTLKSQIELKRSLIQRSDFSFDFVWQNSASYETSSRTINWGTNQGKVKMSSLELETLIGISVSL